MKGAAWRFFPLIALVLLLAVLAWRAWLQRRRYGRVGIFLFRAGPHGTPVRDMLFILFLLLIVGQAVAASASPEAFAALSLALPSALQPVARLAGAVLVVVGFVVLVTAQLHLVVAWRIGIEEGARPGLITSGVYRVCRNPIFVGMLSIFTGITLLLPTRLSLLLLIGVFIGIRQQVLVEEKYLLGTYGDEYRHYARRVGRFVSWIGRLS